MYLKPTDRLPEKLERSTDRNNNSLKMLILNFYNSDEDLAEIIFDHGEYSSSSSLYSGVKKALSVLGDLPVEAEFRQGGVYLRRTE